MKARHLHQINNDQLNQVDNFVYLGGTIEENGSSGEDIKTRIHKADTEFQRLNTMWLQKTSEINHNTALSDFDSVNPV